MAISFAKWLGRTPLLAAIVGAVGVASAMAEESPRYYYGPHMWDGGGWFLGPFVMLFFLGLVVVAVVLLVRWLGGSAPSSTGPAPRQTALDILRERFARGEIDKAEFDHRKQVLEG